MPAAGFIATALGIVAALALGILDSWLEHLRQHRRVTKADRALEQAVLAFLRHPPTVTHYVAARSGEARCPRVRKSG